MRPKAHKNLDFVLEMPENEGSRPQKRTKMPILCSGMVAASPAAPTGTQHCPPQTLRSASGSSTPGNRLPQPTTQPVAVHAAETYRRAYCRNLLPRPTCRSYYRAYRSSATAEELPPCMLPGILPRSGSRAQRAGDSDVGANNKGACDDPSDGVDAH